MHMLIGELSSLCDKSSLLAPNADSCFLLWRRRLCERLKPLPQTSQLYGLSPVCSLKWFLRLDARVKLFSQSGQSNFSPKWIFSVPAREKWRPQSLHVYGFSPVWILVCRRSSPGATNDLSHCVHVHCCANGPGGFSFSLWSDVLEGVSAGTAPGMALSPVGTERRGTHCF
uniref:Uncharacterized protein n=1 Tax=Cyclopterus lumpus TaxID=8103 RepID=A0A8C2WJA3_CYCLU